MSNLVSSPSALITNCNTDNNDNDSSPITKLVHELYLSDNHDDNTKQPEEEQEGEVQQQLQQRIWKLLDDPDSIREYMVGDDVSTEQGMKLDDDKDTTNLQNGNNAGAADLEQIWWRTSLVIRSLLLPARRDWKHKQQSLQTNKNNNSNNMSDNDNNDTEQMDQDDDNNNNDDDDDTWKDQEDVLAEIHDALQRYRPVILATLAKDMQAHEENLQLKGVEEDHQQQQEGTLSLLGEISILQQVSQITSYSPHVIFTSCLEYLIQTQIVSTMAVFKWLLQHEISTKQDDDDKNKNSTFSNVWWNYASMALRVGIITNVTKDTDDHAVTAADDLDIGMVIDTVGVKEDDDAKDITMDEDVSPSLDRMKKVIQYSTPLIQYAAQRVCTMLIELNHNFFTIKGKNRKNKKQMLPLEVDLVEGFKHLIRSTWHQINNSFIDSENDSITTITTGEQQQQIDGTNNNREKFEKLLSKSTLSGHELASYCRSSCANYELTFAELVIQTLDQL
eukprot:CAMPEP_0197824908 /NCGR_PEP_ID=MMETSP1437-20131217/2096_1 /TAXON_ID=49252 ORGANISM="Eucampia antarctica, Strain CCMP1452" /NCGR_SAMPLE_ID=MMETSP1437 /ASSEMBLY_ACC=CAM_ASM_001096 /LENGTH=503 /DNA_ID=CAMNT_0043424713 /DNA_START=31 /DNA_END=1542 /DNA_ORIENTATION=-